MEVPPLYRAPPVGVPGSSKRFLQLQYRGCVGAQMRSPPETGVRALLRRNAPLWKAAKALYYTARRLNRRLVLATTWRSTRNALAFQPGGLQVQLGCGDRGVAGMLNIDARVTGATDMVADCSRLSQFDRGSLTMIFSNAFFEHLYRQQQLSLLRDCVRTLKPGGLLLFLGIPNFEIVCREYLDTGGGSIGGTLGWHEYIATPTVIQTGTLSGG